MYGKFTDKDEVQNVYNQWCKSYGLFRVVAGFMGGILSSRPPAMLGRKPALPVKAGGLEMRPSILSIGREHLGVEKQASPLIQRYYTF